MSITYLSIVKLPKGPSTGTVPQRSLLETSLQQSHIHVRNTTITYSCSYKECNITARLQQSESKWHRHLFSFLILYFWAIITHKLRALSEFYIYIGRLMYYIYVYMLVYLCLYTGLLMYIYIGLLTKLWGWRGRWVPLELILLACYCWDACTNKFPAIKNTDTRAYLKLQLIKQICLHKSKRLQFGKRLGDLSFKSVVI